MDLLPADSPLAVALADAIRGGKLPVLQQLLADNPGLATARIAGSDGCQRTLLHVATDWPGYFPNGPAVVELLPAAGADPNAPVVGTPYAETPLHWAASSDDSDVAAALIDGGADLEAPGASIAGGPPLDDAVGYGCWHVARLLVDRGARVVQLWKAAALGLQSRVMELVEGNPHPPRTSSITRSGRPATADNAEPPSTCSPAVPPSTPSLSTPTKHRWTSPAAPAPAPTA